MYKLKSYDELFNMADETTNDGLIFNECKEYGGATFYTELAKYCDLECEIVPEEEANAKFKYIESTIKIQYSHNICLLRFDDELVVYWFRKDWLEEINDKAFDVDIEELI